MRGEIWFGDLVRAVAVLGATDDPAEVEQVARLLGLTGTDAPPKGPGTGDDPAAPPVAEPGEVKAAARSSGEPPAPERSPPRPRTPSSVVVREHHEVVPLTERDWADAVPLEVPTQRHRSARPPHHRLLPPKSERAILQAILSHRVPDGQIDVPRLVDMVARGRPVRTLPRLQVPTMRFGVQVLVDMSPAMDLFARDQDSLVEQVRGLVGKHATDTRNFVACPLRDKGYRPPAPGSRVLVLSDFGMGGRPLTPERCRPREWEAFVQLLRSHECSPVGLVPFPARRWPSWLVALLPLVTWDRETTVSRAQVRMSRG
ncbi:hypothetical protein ACFWNN_42530 [Lentzea sp. NPDC058450]|uniref:hypothetical protein n=1 Tax=Lentzea sp. NPDC058450 TaxID=3346505 RepID=UPI00365FC9AC